MSTRVSAAGWTAVWTSPDPEAPSTRLEVGLFRSVADKSTTVYISKYRRDSVGSSSVGIGLTAAENVAEALREAISIARATRP
jgi:hypothetical protein